MAAVLSLIIILIISLVATRIATLALVHTGLSLESAKFQARSALTGVGFTTSESESVVNHPVRRRIVMVLMLVGNAGIVTAMASLLLAFIDVRPGSMALGHRLLILALGLATVWFVSMSRIVDRWLSLWISRALERWTDLNVRDYVSLLHLAENHQIREMAVRHGDWLAGKTLAGLALADEGVIVVGIQRPDSRYVPAPSGGTRIERGDVLVIYGSDERLKDLDTRPTGSDGDAAHRNAVAAHEAAFRERPNDRKP